MYTLTMNTTITNSGASTTVKRFDTWYELDDYVGELRASMTDDDYELLMYNSTITESED